MTPTAPNHAIRSLLAALALAAAAGCASVHVSASGSMTARASDDDKGRFVDAPRNLTSFSPEHELVSADAMRLDLRRVFEDLGPDATLWYQHVQTLANPFFEGRMPGSRGSDLTAEYIAFYFARAGLEPVFTVERDVPGGAETSTTMSYQQPFDLPRGRVTVHGSSLALHGQALVDGEDYAVVGNSAGGSVEGPVTFVGYGIADGPEGYTSFDDDTDLTGRIALMLRYAPVDESGDRIWTARQHARGSAMTRKAAAVAERGAEAILLVNPPVGSRNRSDLESVDSTRGWGRTDIPVIMITQELAEVILEDGDAEGRDLEAMQQLADEASITTLDLADDVSIELAADVERQSIVAQNVGGVLPGRGELADEWVVVCGHHDHVGDGSMGGTRRRGLHPGADDNASGTAGVLVLADRLAEAYADTDLDDMRSVLFVTFDAEEMGLIGSRHFANDPPIDLDAVSLAVNMDMIGRLRAGELMVLGTSTGDGLHDFLEPLVEASGLTVAASPRGSGRSDDANLHAAGIAALHLFTGMTPEYTTPQDEAHTVSPAGASQVLDLAYAITWDAAARPEPFAYVEPPAPSGPGQNRGYAPVRLGITPDMNVELEHGVPVASVADDTSAADGGMMGGDVIIGWDKDVIEGMGDLMTKLRAHKPGDVVKITVLRGDEEVVLDVTLKAR